MKKTSREFAILNFKDRNNNECSLQKSSIATENCIWLGVDDADPQVFIHGEGWQPLVYPEKDTLFTTRMHLNQQQVKELLPILTKFAETGEL